MALGKATWLRLLSLLFALTSSFCESSHEDEDLESVDYEVTFLQVTNATDSSLTFVAAVNCNSPEDCKEVALEWQYSSQSDQHLNSTKWVTAFTTMWDGDFEVGGAEGGAKRGRGGVFRITITDLRPAVEYKVRALVWKLGSSARPHNARAGRPVAVASTCPEQPQKAENFYEHDKGLDFLVVWWHPPVNACVSTAYFLQWTEYDDQMDIWEKSPQNTTCPSESVFITNSTDTYCSEGAQNTICYVIKNITYHTRYMMKLYTTDSSKNCSEPVFEYSKTAFLYWGGITVGVWCLIVLCVVLAVGAMPVVIHLKKRMVLEMLGKENIVFRKSPPKQEDCPEEDRDPDGYLISASV